MNFSFPHLLLELLMVLAWVTDEMNTVDLNDARLDNRLQLLLSDLSERPNSSIPAACGGFNETTAAYRFFDNSRVRRELILQPHFDNTLLRVQNQTVALFLQDTTQLDLTRPKQNVQGTGPLDTPARQGVFLHQVQTFTPDGLPLGSIYSHTWTREEETTPLSAEGKRQQRRKTPIEDKESNRWILGLRATREVAQKCPGVTCVSIADSEADIYEMFVEPRGEINPVHFLIRICQDRSLELSEEDEESLAQTRHIRERVASTPVLDTQRIEIRGREAKIGCETRGRRQPRESREAVVEVRATTMTLRPPPRPDRVLPEVTVNVVMVSEVNAPAGDVPVEWVLITTLPINNTDEVRTVVAYYKVRWLIEVYFRTLKMGCRVEDRLFENLDRLLRCLSLYEIVAWRTLYVCRLGRSCPEMKCDAIFEPAEWQSVWWKMAGTSPPLEAPSLSIMIRLIAQLGGYVNRRNREDPPGPQTVWLGLQRMYDLAWAWETFGPGANKDV